VTLRHKKDYKLLGRWPAHRKSFLRNLVASLFLHEKIETTYPRAKAVKRLAEKLITIAKEDTVAARRLVAEYIPNPLRRQVITKLFREIAPRYKDRNGGYTRVIKTGVRRGDAAQEAVLMLIE